MHPACLYANQKPRKTLQPKPPNTLKKQNSEKKTATSKHQKTAEHTDIPNPKPYIPKP